MTTVVLIRPGATVYDEQNRIQGVLDVPLSDRGWAEVAELSSMLASMELTSLYCGPSENALRTAETVGRTLGLRPRRVEELRNLDQGLWQGLQVEEIKRRHQKVFRQWIDDPCTVSPPHGEPVDRAIDRIKVALKPLIKRHRNETIGLVACEPIAQFIACYLRRDSRVQLADQVPTGKFEMITVGPEWGRNGDDG
ncbi:histidine phosphatase family protein [Tundrisphaera lichenicola]|uniref:histidine phosphatase family protein n=1 Tax=Tundrisphaera lichenicola TaxID=2029860 RepID=UPI003EB824E5